MAATGIGATAARHETPPSVVVDATGDPVCDPVADTADDTVGGRDERRRTRSAQAGDSSRRARASATGRAALHAVPSAMTATDDPQPARQAKADPVLDDERRREALATNITRCALEAIAGVRDLDQLARWVTPLVYRSLLARVQHAERARRARRRAATRPTVQVRALHAQHAATSTEATLVVEFGPRVRAVCVHLERDESRWRATSVAVL